MKVRWPVALLAGVLVACGDARESRSPHGVFAQRFEPAMADVDSQTRGQGIGNVRELRRVDVPQERSR